VPKLLTKNFSSTQGASESSGENLTKHVCTLQRVAQSDGSALVLLENPVFRAPTMAQELLLLIKGKRDVLKLNLLERNASTCPLISLHFATSD